MSTERDVIEVFKRANPVPDPELVEVEPDAGRFLAVLLDERPTEVRTSPAGAETGKPARRWIVPTVAAAVVAVVVAGIAVLVRSGDGSEVPADTMPVTVPDVEEPVAVTTPSSPPPGTTATTVPTTTVPTTTVPTTTAPVTVAGGAVSPAQSPDDIPLVESGATYSSPVGDITWTRIDGDAASLPGSIDFEADGRFYGVDDDGTSWVSDDSLAWSETDPLPGASGDYVNVGEDVWTMIQPDRAGEPARLGRWNGVRFEPVDLTEIARPDVPPGLRVVEEFADLDAVGDTLVVTAGSDLGLDPANDVMGFSEESKQDAVIQWIDDNTYVVIMVWGGTASPAGPEFTLTPDTADPDVALVTASDGNVVGRVGPVAGFDAEELIEQLRAGGVAQRETFLGGENGLDRLENLPSELRSVVQVGDGVLALSSGGEAGSSFSLWRTDDLSTWESVDVPMDEPGTIRWASLASSGTEALLDLQIDPPWHGEVWSTSDSTTWRLTNAPRGWGSVSATDFGWVRWGGSPELAYEEDIDVVYVRENSDWRGFRLGYDRPPVGNEIWTTSKVLADTIFVVRRAGSDRTIWVGDVKTG